MKILLKHLLGISFIPILWVIAAISIAALIFTTAIISFALIIVPGSVTVNGVKLFKLLSRKNK